MMNTLLLQRGGTMIVPEETNGELYSGDSGWMTRNTAVCEAAEAAPQLVYLDFDGAETRYCNAALGLDFHVTVENSQLDSERIFAITAALNEQYAGQNVVFTAEKPKVADTQEYSTVYIGQTSAFEEYGNFAGLAETIDEGNRNRNDNAFVLLDSATADTEIISVISHEVGHIAGGERHENETGTLKDYAAYFVTRTESYSSYVQAALTEQNGLKYTNDTYIIPAFAAGEAKAEITVTNNSAKITNDPLGISTNIELSMPGALHWVVQKGDTSSALTIYNNGDVNSVYVYQPSKLFYRTHVEPLSGYTWKEGGVVRSNFTIKVTYYRYEEIADLAVSDFTVSGSSLTFDKSNKISVSFTVKNIGDKAAGASVAYLYDGEKKIGEISVGKLAAGAVSKKYTYTFAAGKFKQGEHSLTLKVNAENTVSESNYGNNSSQAETIRVNDKSVPRELSISAVKVSKSSITTADTLKFTITVKNTGRSSSGAFHLFVYDGSEKIGSVRIKSIKGKSKYTATYKIAPWKLSLGTHSFTLVADGTSKIKEANEYNNTASCTVFVAQGKGKVNVFSAGKLQSAGEKVLTYQYLSSGCSMLVSKGGTASAVSVSSCGVLRISSGGKVISSWVSSGGEMRISKGGKATSAQVSSGGEMRILNGGRAVDTGIGSAGKVTVLRGGSAVRLNVSSGGSAVVGNGGSAVKVTVSSYGTLAVSSEGRVSGGVIETGAKTDFTVGKKTYIQGSSNGSAFKIAQGKISGWQIAYGCKLKVASGCVASSTTIDSGGELHILKGGSAVNVALSEYGDITVSRGGKARAVDLEDGACYVMSGGRVDSAKVKYGTLTVLSGGSALNVDWNPGSGEIIAAAGAHVTFTKNFSGCYYSGGSASAGSYYGNLNYTNLYVMSNGVAENIRTSDCDVNVYQGGIVKGAVLAAKGYYEHAFLNIYSGGSANDVVVSSNGTLNVLGGTVNNTDIYYRASMNVAYGGVAKNTTIHDFGGAEMTVSSGGVAKNTTLHGWRANMTVLSGGTAANVIVSSGTYLNISSGGKATDVQLCAFGWVYMESGASATFLAAKYDNLTVSSDTLRIYDKGTAGNIHISSGGWVYVNSGGRVSSATLNCSGHMCVSSGGSVNSTIIHSSAFAEVSSGGRADNTCINFGGSMWLGGKAKNVTLNSGGKFSLYDAASVTGLDVADNSVDLQIYMNKESYISGKIAGSSFVIKNGKVSKFKSTDDGVLYLVGSGCVAVSTTIRKYASICVSSGASASKTTIDNIRGIARVAGGTMRKVTLNGSMYVSSGGYVSAVTLKNYFATLNISSGGRAANTVVSSGKVYVSSGGSMSNQLTVRSDGYVTFEYGAIFDFTVAEQSSKTKALISNWGVISGGCDAFYTLTVKENQKTGTYKLAAGASGFSNAISVLSTGGKKLGTLSVGETVDSGKRSFKLVKSGSTLSLKVTAAGKSSEAAAVPDDPESVWQEIGKGDLAGDGTPDTILWDKKSGNLYAWENGNAADLKTLGKLDPDEWEIAAVTDSDMDGRDELIFRSGDTLRCWTAGDAGRWSEPEGAEKKALLAALG